MITYSDEWIDIKVNEQGEIFIASDVDSVNLDKDAALWLYEQLKKSETEKTGMFRYKGDGYAMDLDIEWMDLQIEGPFFEYDICIYRKQVEWLYEQLKKIFDK